jgi:hypothetical protein
VIEELKKLGMVVLVPFDRPEPLGYMNVFEEGDIWIKAKGCEECPIESKKRCCNQCPILIQDTGQCMAHLGVGSLNKPFECVVRPLPNRCYSWCHLEFKCVKGKNEGKVRKISEPAHGF